MPLSATDTIPEEPGALRRLARMLWADKFALAAALFQKWLVQRHVQVPPGLIPWLVPRVERTHVGILQAVEALDEAALARRVRITVKLARDTLGMKQEDLF